MQAHDQSAQLLKRADVARILGCCTRTISRLERRGAIKPIIIGPRLIRYRAEDVAQLVDNGR